MKKIYVLLFAVLFSHSMQSQCIAYMDMSAAANNVTATIYGNGASNPGYIIDWGDDSQDFVSTATHTYTLEGNYLICFTYYDLNDVINCNQSACQEVIITTTGCYMDFTPTTLGLTASIFITSSAAGVPSISIDWGDNSPLQSGMSASHAYAATGNYNICVTFSDLDDPDNCTIYQCHSVFVEEQTGGCTVNLTVTVDGAIITADAVGTGAANANYIITWGDDTFDNAANASHFYLVTGTYEVCAVYGDLGPKGCSVSDCQMVQVDEVGTGSCAMSFSASSFGLNAGLNINATGAEDPSYVIDWGDGTDPTTILPAIHTYLNESVYLVCVSYMDMNNLDNCQISICQEVTITDPVTECSVELTLTQDGNSITVTSTGIGAVDPQYGINWGDNSLPTIAANGSHTYSAQGTYQVCVTYIDLSNPKGCSATSCAPVDIVTAVEENLQYVNSAVMMPNPLTDNNTLEINLNKAAHIQIDVLDLLGKRVENILNGQRSSGVHRIGWNAQSLAGGIYFVRIKADNEERMIRVIR